MFRLHRSARASKGKVREAHRWAREVADYLNSKYAPITFRAYAERFGGVGKVHWYSDYEDLASLERFTEVSRLDQEYRRMLADATDLFVEDVEGSFEDTLMEAL